VSKSRDKMGRRSIGDASSEIISFSPDGRRIYLRLFAVIALLGLTWTSPFLAIGQKSAVSNTEELPAGAMQAKATTACTECHEARIILQQRLSKGAWAKEVDKMTKWGAVVDPADRDAMIDYFSLNFSPDKPPYEPQRTSISRDSRGGAGVGK
jgi:hypothetical protein